MIRVMTVVQGEDQVIIEKPHEFLTNIAKTMKPGQFISLGVADVTEEQWAEASDQKYEETKTSTDFSDKIMNAEKEDKLKSSKTEWPGQKEYTL